MALEKLREKNKEYCASINRLGQQHRDNILRIHELNNKVHNLKKERSVQKASQAVGGAKTKVKELDSLIKAITLEQHELIDTNEALPSDTVGIRKTIAKVPDAPLHKLALSVFTGAKKIMVSTEKKYEQLEDKLHQQGKEYQKTLSEMGQTITDHYEVVNMAISACDAVGEDKVSVKPKRIASLGSLEIDERDVSKAYGKRPIYIVPI